MSDRFRVEKVNCVSFYTFKLPAETVGSAGELPLPDFRRFLALHRPVLYWMENAFGSSPEAIPHETQCLILELPDGVYRILLPLCSGDLRATLRGSETGVSLDFSGALTNPETAVLLAAAEGKELYSVMNGLINEVQKRLGSFQLRERKKRPEFLKYLGWCTWDAFYKTVDAGKMLDGLASFKRGRIAPGFAILDDGYQQCDAMEHLTSFAPDPVKFPDGLSGLIRAAKKKGLVRRFGVWHAFQGYWAGIDLRAFPEYPGFKNRACIHPWLGKDDRPSELVLVEPEAAKRFYGDYHRYLKSCGADLVKVDNQASFSLAIKGIKPWVSSTRIYHYALQESVDEFFRGNLINCMCHSSDLFFNFRSANLMRNSDDYQPQFALSGQQHHVAVNAANAFLNSFFAWPDWDMFQSHSSGADIHAAARAISGGPVYVCDRPWMQNFRIIRRLCDDDSLVLAPDRPGLATADTLLADCEHSDTLLKITNRIRSAAVVAAFNLRNSQDGQKIAGDIRAADVHDLKSSRQTRFAAVAFGSRKVRIVRYDEPIRIKVAPDRPAYWRLVPIRNDFAALGDLSKYNSMAAFSSSRTTRNGFAGQVRRGCSASFYCREMPDIASDRELKIDFDGRLLTVKPRKREAFRIELYSGTR